MFLVKYFIHIADLVKYDMKRINIGVTSSRNEVFLYLVQGQQASTNKTVILQFPLKLKILTSALNVKRLDMIFNCHVPEPKYSLKESPQWQKICDTLRSKYSPWIIEDTFKKVDLECQYSLGVMQ